MIMKRLSLLAVALAIGLSSCQKDEEPTNSGNNGSGDHPVDPVVLNLPDTPCNYANLTLPNHLTGGPVANADNTPATNPTTDAGATLGRVLFYDTQLSLNNTVSCASCHQANNGFSDPLAFSVGFEGGETGRHSMNLINARYYAPEHFFWDGRAETLEDQVLMPIQDEVEMGMTLDSLMARLQTLDYYPDLFEEAFGTQDIDEDRVSRALAQFVRSIVSYQSPYDIAVAATQGPPTGDLVGFTDEENLGKQIFEDPTRGACGACHGTPVQIAPAPRSNGLDANPTDIGFGEVTGDLTDYGLFKTPSLRSIELTAPYMHDGRFATLEEVIEHYNSGVQNHANLSPPLRLANGQIRRLNLTQDEKDALKAFLLTLTDHTLATEERFGDPFVN